MNLLETIGTLSTTPEECGEALAQSLDILAQSLESIDQLLGDHQEQIRRSFGDHARNLEQLRAPSDWLELLSNIRRFRKKINVLEPEEILVAELFEMIAELLQKTGVGGRMYHRRVRYRPHLINTVGVDTPTGFGQFQLYHGSAIQMPCDVLVVSGRVSPEGKVDGQVVNALRWRYNLTINSKDGFVRESDEIWLVHQEINHPNAPFKHVLCLFLPPEPKRAQALYQQGLQTVFAALSALEYLDVPCRKVGMSFLAGHRVQGMDNAVETLVLASLQWLKKSARAQEVSCTLLQMDEVDSFNCAMNTTLGRSTVGDGDPMISALRTEVLTLAARYKDGPLKPALGPLYEALNVQGDLCIELICTFSRTLCEVMVRECLKMRGQKSSGDLLNSIEKLRKTGMIAPWVSSYMHGLRVVGNKSVHPAHKPPKYLPAQLGSADLVTTMSAARCLLDFWDQHIDPDSA